MQTLVPRIPGLARLRVPMALGAALSLAAGAALYMAAAATIEKDARERFTTVVRTAQYTILGRVKSYTDVLRGAASLFQTTPDLTREQFHRYVQGLQLQTEFPGIESINYAKFVTDAERPAFEHKMRAEPVLGAHGYPGFHITPPGRRDGYLVLTYIEPAEAWAARVGVDIMARPSAHPAIFESRDTGAVGASGVPIPMLRAITGLGMRLPVYRPGMPLNTAEQRRAAWSGSVGIGFSVERLMDGVLDQLPAKGLRLRMVGVVPAAAGQPERRIVLYDTEAQAGRPRYGAIVPSDDEFSLSVPIDYNRRFWQAHFSIRKTGMLTGLDAYMPWFAGLAGAVSTALLYALFHTLSSSRRRAVRLAEEMTRELRSSESNLQLSNAKLRQLAAHAEHIKESERKRIAREIHDDLGQNLLALRIETDLLASRTGERHPLLHARAVRTLEQIDAIIKSVRQIINDLRPNVLDLGLNAAVDWQIDQFRRRTGIACEVVENDHDIQVSDRCATALFRILQESLTNIARHARATRVRVELHVGAGLISMSVSDDGVGLHPAGQHKAGSFGLVGIEERVHILGGSCTIATGALGGTSISVTMPLAERQEPAGQPADRTAPAAGALA